MTSQTKKSARPETSTPNSSSLTAIGRALRAMPVAINCYYGDPCLQWNNTIAKLESLAESGHTGPVSVITKGSIGPARAKQLKAFNLPGLLVMVSISELAQGKFEGVGHEHRLLALQQQRLHFYVP